MESAAKSADFECSLTQSSHQVLIKGHIPIADQIAGRYRHRAEKIQKSNFLLDALRPALVERQILKNSARNLFP